MRLPARTIVLIALAIGTALGGQVAAPGDRAEILKLEDGWTNALLKRDKAYFTQTLAAGFVYTEDDRLYTREEVLRDIVSPSDTVTAAHNEAMVAHMFGTTAAVTGVLIVNGRSGGKVYHHRYRFTDTWQKQKDGKWRIVAAQDYLTP